MHKSFRKTAAATGLSLILSIAGGAAAYAQNVLPSMDNMKMHFGNGNVANNKPQLSTNLPNIPGATSQWNVVQWSKFQHLDPAQMTTNNSSYVDPVLGKPNYSFTAADQLTHLYVYQNGPNGHPVYELFEQDGNLGPGGGRNLFLSTAIKPPVTFDHPVNFSMQARVAQAQIQVTDSGALQTNKGALLGMAFIGFAMNFPNPVNGKSGVFFLQVGLTQSAGNPQLKTICSINKNGGVLFLAGGDLSGTTPMAFQPGSALQNISFNVSDYVNQVFSKPVTCQVKGGSPTSLSLQNIPRQEIQAKTVYIGLETQNADARPKAKNTQPMGHVKLGLQVSNVQLSN